MTAETILNQMEDSRDYRLLAEMNGQGCAQRQIGRLKSYSLSQASHTSNQLIKDRAERRKAMLRKAS